MRVSVVFDTPWTNWTPDDHRRQMERELAGLEPHEPEMEYQVAGALIACGHEVMLVGIHDDPRILLDHLATWHPDLVVNCAESFVGDGALDFVSATLLEARHCPYTGSPPLALQVSRDKAMSKKVLAYHGVRVPAFVMYGPRDDVTAPPPVGFPAIVKPLASDGSAGISQASVVDNLPELRERVAFVHARFRQPAIVEQFIPGRELYAGLLGNGERLEVLPLMELVFDKEKNGIEERIATQAVKWTEDYRRRRGIRTVLARPVSARARERIEEACRAAARALWLRDYARVDFRLTDDDEVWVLEANANPFLSKGHEMATAAARTGLPYPRFINRIAQEALARHERA